MMDAAALSAYALVSLGLYVESSAADSSKCYEKNNV